MNWTKSRLIALPMSFRSNPIIAFRLRKLREDINIQHKAVDECRNELSTLLEEVNKMRAKDMGKERNK
jgi:hypothetical protein